ncbi:MAG: hypothetical protein V1818_01830 [Candidatus Aenigmatarchaeota archaeon]
MGFLDGIFGGKKEAPKEKRVSLKDTEKIISDKAEKAFEPLKDAAKKEYETFQTSATAMQGQLKILEQAALHERTFSGIASRSTASRRDFIGRMDFLIKKLRAPFGENADSIISFYEEANRTINTVNAETIKDYAFLKMVFEKEGKDVLQSFRQIFEANKSMGETVKEIRKHQSKLSKARECVAEISRMAHEMKEDETGRLNERLLAKEAELRKAESGMEELLREDAWKAFLEMQKTRDELKKEMENKEAEFTDLISELEVPLKKYRRLAENSVLNHYIEKSFYSVLHEDPDGEVLLSALRDMKLRMIEDKMALKGGDRFMTVIDRAKEGNIMGGILKEYASTADRLKKLEEEMGLQKVPRRKGMFEKDINKLKAEREELRAGIEKSEESKKRLVESREQRIRELEELLSEASGERILLEVNN